MAPHAPGHAGPHCVVESEEMHCPEAQACLPLFHGSVQGQGRAGGCLPGPPGGAGAHTGACAERRQHPLHHAAAAQGLEGGGWGMESHMSAAAPPHPLLLDRGQSSTGQPPVRLSILTAVRL